ncbi:AIPR family protein [Pedobacter caeni]|uniref:AIPR protein n=1 Tax=Pedobacter caeni TaxID=288992 RepID=A0A1M5JNQ6_9SPHI|nr:AIPR family protein [Pedobacter caeni]SHG42158.1 AIPR protein [Pedobacter caeni]
MELSEFAVDFLESALITVEDEKISQEDALTKDILEYTIDSGEVIAGELCHYKVRGIKINAWNYDEENEIIDLFVTIFKGESRLQKVSDKDIDDSFNRALNFFWAARDGKLSGKVDESETVVFDLVQIIEETRSVVKSIRIFVFTNGQASAEIVPEAREENGVYVDFQLWDIERIYQQYLIRSDKQPIEIDFLNDYNHKLKCLSMERVSEKVDSYLAIMPASILAKIYGKYRQGILEKNVRNFLQFKTKVNKGIRKTIIDSPDMFFAYNNGISTTAENIDIEYEDNVPYITRIENWQIVNGGQTTASIYATSLEKGIDLSHVFVQLKISKIKNVEEMDLIVPFISKYANSQTGIKDSDFEVNSDFFVFIQKLSRLEWVPTLTGGRATSKWYFERTRGQYLDDKSRLNTSESKKFDKEYPKSKKFTTPDIGKYEMSWNQRPYDVSKGAENNFKIFVDELKKGASEIDKIYYRDLIAKAILFKDIDSIIARLKLGGYKANMVTYLISWISYKTNKKLSLDYIWDKQGISEGVNNALQNMIPIVWQHINSPLIPGTNIGEWCKKPECWISLKDKFVDFNCLNDEILRDSESQLLKNNIGHEISAFDQKILDRASDIKPEVWFSISRWAKENNKLTPFDRKLIYNFGVLANRKAPLSLKQAKTALRLLKSYENETITM